MTAYHSSKLGHELPGHGDEVHVTLPCTPDNFAEFISGLLGKPQTISRAFFILFEIDQDDIAALHNLIVQRVSQQNDAKLTNFVGSIYYDDESSVRINSFEDFMRYNEVRPVRSVAIALTWVFLIRFQDRTHPEKQEITVRFAMPEHHFIRSDRYFDVEIQYPHRYNKPGTVEVQINHTARTWGNDVDNCLKGT